jgi:hypothetical protein
VIRLYRGHEAARQPAGGPQQHGEVAPAVEDLAAGLMALLARPQEEPGYNDAKATRRAGWACTTGPRFTEDAVVDLLERHGHPGRVPADRSRRLRGASA